MRVTFSGHDFDLSDSEMLTNVARNHAEQMVLTQKIAVRADIEEVLTTLLAGLVRYHIVSGAVLASTQAIGAVGITLQQALDQHNYIGELIANAPLDLGLEPEPEAPALIVP